MNVFTDCKGIINRFDRWRRNELSCKVMEHIHNYLEILKYNHGISVSIEHVPGHAGIFGNELAHELARSVRDFGMNNKEVDYIIDGNTFQVKHEMEMMNRMGNQIEHEVALLEHIKNYEDMHSMMRWRICFTCILIFITINIWWNANDTNQEIYPNSTKQVQYRPVTPGIDWVELLYFVTDSGAGG